MKKTLPTTTRSLPIALIRARESIMPPIRAMLANSNLTEQQWRVLRVLSENGTQDATEVSERACLLMPSLTRILRTLVEKKLITRSQDATDRRRQMLEITNLGEKIISANNQEAADIVTNLQSRFGSENYEQLLDLLATLSQSTTESSDADKVA